MKGHNMLFSRYIFNGGAIQPVGGQPFPNSRKWLKVINNLLVLLLNNKSFYE